SALPVAAQGAEGARNGPKNPVEFGPENPLPAIVVLRTPHMLQAGELRSIHARVENDRNVEGAPFEPCRARGPEERIRDPVPPELVSASEVHVDLRVVERMAALARVRRADARLSAVPEYGHEPAGAAFAI